MKRPTLSTPPWDAPPITIDDPMPKSPPKIKDRPLGFPAKTPLDVVASRAFTGNLNASDLRYIALAVLQMQDEAFELREVIRQMGEEIARLSAAMQHKETQ
jgi:hypothetical protein